MIAREALLADTLREWRRTAFAWGESDCLMSVMSYASELCGRDPGAPWRGNYADRAGAYRLLEAAGGAAIGLGRALTGAGMVAVETPVRGDVIVAALGEQGIGGLCLGELAAFRLEGRGVLELRMNRVGLLGAWR
jgi:hypothetical protein